MDGGSELLEQAALFRSRIDPKGMPVVIPMLRIDYYKVMYHGNR